MHLARLRLRDFRNYARLDAVFEPGLHVLLGDNAQGKTNLLEAVYLLATLRSFRGVGSAQLVRQGAKGYLVSGQLVGQAPHEARLYWSATERRLALDGRTMRRAAEYLGTLRAVVFCTEDLLLIKGSGRVRRRFLDLLLSQTRPDYLPTLQRYAAALRARNALLKGHRADGAALEGFTTELVRAGEVLWRARAEFVPRLSPLARLAHRRIAPENEELRIEYRPSVQADFAVELAQARRRETALRQTVIGPHRDEVELLINDRAAAQYASEGQKRTVAIALKMAQAEFVGGVHGSAPVLLIDDVMGELDARRRNGFMPLLEAARRGRGQVFMTGTERRWPEALGRDFVQWRVQGGTLAPG